MNARFLSDGIGRLQRHPIIAFALIVTAALLVTNKVAFSSDHGDTHIGDFYAFVVDGKLVLAMTIAVDVPEDYETFRFPKDVSYRFMVDRDAQVDFSNASDTERYGGTIVNPASIQEDIVIDVKFPTDDGNPTLTVSGLQLGPGRTLSSLALFTGVRDEPFIRQGLQGKNIPAIVVELPMYGVVGETPGDTLLLWGATFDGEGRMLDLGGRAYRSQEPGNRDLNTTHPSEHMSRHGLAPDVVIYNTGEPAEFPNGRALTDDVVDLFRTENPTVNTNDVPFLTRFPYLAAPHDADHHAFVTHAPPDHEGMEVRDLGRLDLGREFASFGGRDVRVRYWTMAPSGIIRLHQHSERPAMVYLLSGEVEEYKFGVEGSRTIRAGEMTVEDANTLHYWINHGDELVTMVAFDIYDTNSEPVAGGALEVPADVEAAEFSELGRIQLREAFPLIPESYDRLMRGRRVIVEPGEVVPLQRHEGRPGITYVLEGVIMEHRSDRAAPFPLRAGDHTINGEGVSRWLENTGDREAVLFEVDFPNQAEAEGPID
jgi:quercetin dioxygenase-like cupin family protein